MVLHLACAARYGWFRDELYYVACARRLAFGYVDHPPLVAVVARASLVLFGDSIVGLRLFAATAAGLLVVVAAALARSMDGGRAAEGIAALAVAVAPYDLVVGHVFTMNALEPLVWGGLALVVTRTLADLDEAGGAHGSGTASALGAATRKRLLWLGPIVGLGILGKHSASWPVAALALGLLVSPARRVLWQWETGIAALIALVLVLPHVVWQIQHGFPTREFARAALAGKNEPYGPAGLVAQLVQLFHPLLVPLWLAGLASLLAGMRGRFRPLGIALLLLVGLVFATQAKVYYLGPAWTWLFAAGAVAFERLALPTLRRRRLLLAYLVLVVLGGAALLPAAVPVLPIASFQAYARALGGLGEQRTGEVMESAALPQLYADMFGWPELARTVERVVADLAPEERAGAVIVAANYGEASAIEHLGRGLPPVVSGDNAWWLWGPPPGRPSPEVVVWVGKRDTSRLAASCGELEEVARADHPLARADERHLPIHVCRRPVPSLVEAWPGLKHYR